MNALDRFNAKVVPLTDGCWLWTASTARGVPDECAQGHRFDEANTFTRPGGARGCRTCRNNASRASKARARAAITAAA
jgi:hypothetical protein